MSFLFEPKNPTRVRFISAIGIPTTVALIGLGSIWPSMFTLAAILVLPAPFLFIAAIIRPKLVQRSLNLRFYLELSIGLSIFCWGIEALWLLF